MATAARNSPASAPAEPPPQKRIRLDISLLREPYSKIFTAKEIASLQDAQWFEMDPGSVMEQLQVRDHAVQQLTDELVNYESEAAVHQQVISSMEAKIACMNKQLEELDEEIVHYQRHAVEPNPYPSDGLPYLDYLDDSQLHMEWRDLCDSVLNFCRQSFNPKEVKLVYTGEVPEQSQLLVDYATQVAGNNLQEVQQLVNGNWGANLLATAIVLQILKEKIFDYVRWSIQAALRHPWSEDSEDISPNFLRYHEEKSLRSDIAFDYKCVNAKLMRYLISHHRPFLTAWENYRPIVGGFICAVLAPLSREGLMRSEFLTKESRQWYKSGQKIERTVPRVILTEASVTIALNKIIQTAEMLALKFRTDWTQIYLSSAGVNCIWDEARYINHLSVDEYYHQDKPSQKKLTDEELTTTFCVGNEKDNKNAAIKLVVFPALLRRGDETGRNYWTERVVTRANVLIVNTAPSKDLKPGRSSCSLC